MYKIKALTEKHLGSVAQLVSDRYLIERKCSHILPPQFEDPNSILPALRSMVSKAPGIVAVSKRKIIGFLIGMLLPSWRGRHSVFVPYYAHAVIGDKRREVFESMYTHLSAEWIVNGCFAHLISVLAHDEDIIDSLFWMGFGMAVIDAMRDFTEVQGPIADIEIKRATLNDIETVMSLSHQYQRYMADSPIFMAMVEKSSREYHEKWISNPSNALWLASVQGEVVSYMKIGPITEDTDITITDEETAGILGAFTKERFRRQGIGTALLKKSLDWAQAQGYKRCWVDFEGENLLAKSFWLKHFHPVCFSLIRQIDQRIAWAHKNREDKHIW